MQLEQKPNFLRSYKKLPTKHKTDVNIAIKTITKNPKIGTKKTSDLSEFRVYKFKINKQEILLGYKYNEPNSLITLYALGSHENFYRNLKNYVSS